MDAVPFILEYLPKLRLVVRFDSKTMDKLMDTRKLLESMRKKQATAPLCPGYVPYLNDGTDTTPEQL